MFRKLFFAGILGLILLLEANACMAAAFQKLYESRHMSESLSSDQAWSKNFNTMDGEMKLQFRKLAAESDDKRFHFTVKRGKDYVYKQHFPRVEGGYSVMVIKDTSTSRLFYAIQSRDVAYLYGFESRTGKFEIYIDSKNYLNRNNGVPKIAVLRDGSLILAFEPLYTSSVAYNQRYSFNWDDRNMWFSYRDLGSGFNSVDYESQ